MSREQKLAEFVAWTDKNITGDEKGQAQIFLDRLFQAFGQQGSLDVGGTVQPVLKSESSQFATFAILIGEAIALPRRLLATWRLRDDLRARFPAIPGADEAALVAWEQSAAQARSSARRM